MDSNNTGNSNRGSGNSRYYIVNLDLREDLAETKIIEEFVVDFRTENVRVILNGKYKNHTVVSGFSIKDWGRTVEELEDKLAKKKVDQVDIRNIGNTLDSNNARLCEEYFKAEGQLAEEEELKAEKRFDKILEVVKDSVVNTFVDDTNRSVAVVRAHNHVENKFIAEDAFKRWIGKIYYDYAEAIRLAAIEECNDVIPSAAASILSEVDIEKIQSALLYEEVGTCCQQAEKYERQLLQGFEGRNKVELREINYYGSDNNIPKKDPAGGKKKLSLRVDSYIDPEAYFSSSNGKNESYVRYDLGDETWNYIEITPQHGVRIVRSTEETPSPFKRYSTTTLPQLYPDMHYDAEIFERFILNTNLHRNHTTRLLCEVYIISLFMMADLPKPIMVPNGPQGTGKSTVQEHIKRLVDPSSVLTITAQTEPKEVIQALSHSYLTIFDNVSEIKDWLSDLLCRVVTKTSFSKRQLYTDDSDYTYNMIRAIGFNGLNVTATKADLLERILKITLDPIHRDDREKLSVINKSFEDMLPQLLGFIFDTIHKVLCRIGEVNLRKNLPRMADWTELGELIARVLGYDDMEFVNAYNENLGSTSERSGRSKPCSSCSH